MAKVRTIKTKTFLIILGFFAVTMVLGMFMLGIASHSSSLKPNNIYRFISQNIDRHPGSYTNIKRYFYSHSNFKYLLIRTENQIPFISYFKKDVPFSTVQTIKQNFQKNNSIPRGYFRTVNLDNYYAKLQAANGAWLWYQIGLKRSSASAAISHSIGTAVIILSFLAIIILLLYYFLIMGAKEKFKNPKQRDKDFPQKNKALQSSNKKYISSLELIDKQKKKSEKEESKTVKTFSKESKSGDTPLVEKHAAKELIEKKDNTEIKMKVSLTDPSDLQISEAETVETRVDLNKKSPDSKNEFKLNKQEKRSKNAVPKEIPLKEKNEEDKKKSALVFWEHKESLGDFWKKFLKRISVHTQKGDYLFLFMKEDDFPASKLTSKDELVPVAGLKGSLYLSAEYITENKVKDKIYLKSLLEKKGSLTSDTSLLQLPLLFKNQVFGAFLLFRHGGGILNGQLQQIWKEISSLSSDILKIKQYDMALRDDVSGLFNQRHFQYSLAQNYKLRGSVPNRALFLLNINLPFSQKDSLYDEKLKEAAKILRKLFNDKEEIFLYFKQDSMYQIAFIAEAKPLDDYEFKLKVFLKKFEKDIDGEVSLNAGYCILNEDIFSAKRWLDQVLIALQSSVSKGENIFVLISGSGQQDTVKLEKES